MKDTMIEPLWRIERDHIIHALEYFKMNRTKAAHSLEISIRTLRNKIRQYQAQGHWIAEADGFTRFGTLEKAQDERPSAYKNFEMPEIL